MEIKSKQKTILKIGDFLYGESALYILEGAIIDDNHRYESKQILIAKDAKLCHFEMEENTTVYIFGGEPFEEQRFIFWNFVSSSQDRIEQAKQDWIHQRFPKVANETKFVPLPDYLIDKRPI